MKLYGYWRSSSTWRVRIALAWKGVPHTYQPIHLVREGGQQHFAGFQSVNPVEQVPVLEFTHSGKSHRLSQSFAIIDYLEASYPRPPLYPLDAYDAARARELAELVNSGIQPLQNLSVLNRIRDELKGDAQAWARHFIGRGLAALETLSREDAADFLIGEEPSVADVYLVPQLYNARRFGVDLTPFPTLLHAEASCLQLSAFVDSHPDRQPDAEQTT